MSINKKHIVLSFLLALVSLQLSAQSAGQAVVSSDSSLINVVNYIKHAILFNKVNPQEKVYLHFDNTGYFKGETMRFKAYAIRTDTGAPSSISHVLYVELLNPSGDVVLTRKVKMENGQGNGDFALDSIFGTGFYEVRAYTRYMRNFGGDCAFSRVFPVYRKPAKEGDYSQPKIDELSYVHRLPDGRQKLEEGYTPNKKKSKNSSNTYKVAFYPEGGDLVDGVPTRVAFDVRDEDGKHAQVMGILSGPDGQNITTVQTDASGRGVFELTPSPGKHVLTITTESGKRMDFTLPLTKAEGCVLNVNALGNEISAVVKASEAYQGQLLGYTLMNRGVVVSYDTLTAETALELSFDRSTMAPGVNQLTVFDGKGQILSERLFFVCPPRSDNDSVRVTMENSSLGPCSRVRVFLNSQPNSSLSFSAMDAATLTDGKVGNAQTWMLLTSDVRGYIENPDYYFEADDQEHRQAADLLMMVQGWRRYDWSLYTDKKPWSDVDGYLGHLQPIEDKLYIHGELMKDMNKWRKKHPVQGVDLKVFLYNQQGEHYVGETVTDSVGHYAFKLPDIEGEWNMQMQTKYNDKNAAYTVAVDRHFSPAPRYLSPYETEPIPLPEAFVKAKKEAEEAENNPNLAKRNGVYVIPTVKVKKRYFTDDSWMPWYDEQTGARHSTVYYNVDEATDMINDLGQPLPTIYEWLKQKNSFFGGDNELREMYRVQAAEEDEEFISTENVGKLEPVDGDVTDNYKNIIYKGGLMYKNRPIVWIMNNQFNTVTQYTKGTFSVEWTSNESGAQSMPDFMDEVKSIYISEDDDQYTKFIRATELAAMHPVTIYIYTHPRFYFKEKGIRRTHFQGFNVPTKFEMDDYSVMPPMEDFRRTLFWEPNVKTDASGGATVEFFNNSSCKQIYFSVEGFTPQGQFLVSE